MSKPLSSAARVAREINRVLKDNPAALGSPAVQNTLREIQALDQDFEEKGGVFFHTGSDAFATADKFTQIHIDQYRETGRPSLPALAVYHAQKMGFDKKSPEYKALILVAVRAEMKAAVTPDYHNQFHYLDVAAVTANLLQVKTGAIALTKQEQALTFIAAIGHDLGHEGVGNPKDQPMLNEQISFELMAPLLQEAGLTGPDIDKIHTILMTTSPNGPHAILKAVAQAQRNGSTPDFAAIDPKNDFSALSDSRLTQMAAIVSDADLYASSGAGLKANAVMSALLTKEGKGAIDFTTDNARKYFLDNIAGEGPASYAGHATISESVEALRAETNRRLAAPKP